MSISVIMGSYNYAHYLPKALDAICNQSLEPAEVIIVDDASSDNSVEIIKEYQKKYPFIRLEQNEKNQGIIKTANYAIRLTTSEYVVFCAADDEVMPDFFKKSVEMLEKYPEAALCTSIFSVFFNENDTQLTEFGKKISEKPSYLSPDELVSVMQKKDVRIGGQNTIFRREQLMKTELLIAEIGPMSDWFLLLELAFQYGICYIPEQLTKMRIHEHAFSQKMLKQGDPYQQAIVFILKKLSGQSFTDVKMGFKRSGVFYQFGSTLIPHIGKIKRYWNVYLLRHLCIVLIKTLFSHVKKRFLKLARNYEG